MSDGRRVADDERAVWAEVREMDRSGVYDRIRVAEAARRAGVPEPRARQFARTWANDGLVSLAGTANKVRLTDEGRAADL